MFILLSSHLINTFYIHIESNEIQAIFKHLFFSEEEELKIIRFGIKKKVFKKGAIIIKADAIVTTTYGIQNGCLKTYPIDKQGKKHTLISKNPAMQAYTNSLKDREYLFTKIPKLEAFIRKKLENSYAAFQKRILLIYLRQQLNVT
jgi:hypothetical protein